jgi:hypothetical protein
VKNAKNTERNPDHRPALAFSVLTTQSIPMIDISNKMIHVVSNIPKCRGASAIKSIPKKPSTGFFTSNSIKTHVF